ncbi:hypothetical protein N7466_000576 [Penicillium verhagenii]|uniref:uncharacterized protein n=1 Tax=Penicillium verhagenii TaxID=1562060 RepID=UPI0025451141|nr:uncharacterized protein N7466_000576 [Penicillium verhagenii]KAJ5947561.1 hypothetical protein N7466_000576 [Penicillium verhagenii]
MDSDTFPTRWDGTRLSSSPFSRPGWSRLSPSYAPPTSDAGPSHHADWRHYESALDESDRSHRSTALHQAHSSRPLSRRDKPVNPAAYRQLHSVPTQPVLVRAYSGNAEGTTITRSPTMSPRRLFPFTGPRTSAPTRSPGPPLPSDKDFSIESILQAIEPDIRGTLDSIADICGRSKLSLANEYGSHIAPLGEIRAPPGGLVPVEEVSTSDERRDEGVVIFDDDPNLMAMDASRDTNPFSYYRYIENLRQAASALERNGEPGPTVSAPSVRTRSAAVNNHTAVLSEPDVVNLPNTRDFISRPKHSGRDLLAKHITPQDESVPQDIATHAVVSEVHLEARAEEGHLSGDVGGFAMNNSIYLHPNETWQASDIIHSLLGWLRWTARVAEPENRPALQSAESRLRAMLQQSAIDRNISALS